MAPQTVTLTDVLADAESTAFLLITPQTPFADSAGTSHAKTVRVDYTSIDSTPTLSAVVVASDSTGNTPSPVYYTIRRVLGSDTQEWKDVFLHAAEPTVALSNLDTEPGAVPVTATRVVGVSVNGVPVATDPDGIVDLDIASTGSLATETTQRQAGDTANSNAIANETLRAVGREDAVQAAAETYTDSQITALKGGASGALDTLAEIDAQIAADEGSAAALAANVATKATGRVGPTDPAPTLTPGTEYVWFQTDGAGTLLDILTGVA